MPPTSASGVSGGGLSPASLAHLMQLAGPFAAAACLPLLSPDANTNRSSSFTSSHPISLPPSVSDSASFAQDAGVSVGVGVGASSPRPVASSPSPSAKGGASSGHETYQPHNQHSTHNQYAGAQQFSLGLALGVPASSGSETSPGQSSGSGASSATHDAPPTAAYGGYWDNSFSHYLQQLSAKAWSSRVEGQ